MGFIDLASVPVLEPLPGCRLRTPFGQNLMLSHLEMETGAEIPWHQHPHEQGGMLIKGTLQLSIGEETRVVEPGAMFLIPPNVPHRAVAIQGPVLVLDVFSPIREDYAAMMNRYIPVNSSPVVDR
jgi:quercetin dioxygenase-like cupin family protein